MEMLLQQGDLIFWEIDKLPEGNKKQDDDVIHYGATGNHHKMTGRFSIHEKDGIKYMMTAKGAKLKHEEHKPIIFPAGVFKLEFVQEKDHFSDLVRAVVD